MPFHSLKIFDRTDYLCKNYDVECCTVSVFLLLALYILSLNYLPSVLHIGKVISIFLKKTIFTSKINPSGAYQILNCP